MRMRMRCFCVLGVLVTFLFSLLSGMPCAAADADADLSRATAAVLYHVESDRLMRSKNETARIPAGATVKLLSGLLACEALSGQLSEPIEISAEMVKDSAGYRYKMKAGEVYTVEQLLYLALCGSYNDAYDVLAYLIGGGSVSNFVQQMNERAVALGAVDTVIAKDPTGISDSSLTSAQDLLCIAKAAMQNSLYMQMSGVEVYDLPQDRIYNRNALLSKAEDSRYYNARCRGMTAGVTARGVASVITLAQNGNDRYLCIVLSDMEDGENVENHSYRIANELIEWAYKTYTYLEVLTPSVEICKLPVKGSDMVGEVSVCTQEPLSVYLPAGATVGKEVTYSIRLMYEELQAPVSVGTPVGYVAVVYQGEICGTLPLYTAEAAEKGSVVSGLLQIKNLTQSRRVRAGGSFFLVAVTGWLLGEYIVMRRRRHKWDKYFSSKIDLPEALLTKKRDNGRHLR